MKKFILICLMASFIFGTAQEKKISFAKELNYQMINKNAPLATLKMYANSNNEFLTKFNIKDSPTYYYTDGLGTSTVSLEMNNRLSGSLSSLMYLGYAYMYNDDTKEFTLDSKKLNTKETVLGMPCTHYLISYMSKNGERKENDDLKLCIDDKSTFNNFSVLNGILRYIGRAKIKGIGVNGLILKAGPEKTYDTEHFILTSMKDSKDFVYFDHRKTMTDQQRKVDSLMLAYKKQEEDYVADSVVDSAAVVVDSAAATYPYSDESYYIPEYVSEYKKGQDEDGSLAITNIPNENLWKGLPGHCKNFEKELPQFNNKDLKKHLRNYVGQMCDMYLTQAENHNVGIKITLDEIRREVLYLNDIHDKLDEADKKKLNTYLKNLD